MPVDHRERAFEAAIEDCLLTRGGYAKADPEKLDRERAIDPTVFILFIKETQPETWQALEKLHGTSTEAVILDDLTKALDGQAGALAVIRHGFKCFGKLIRVAFFAPAHSMNPDTQRLYQASRLTITRQLHYSTRHENSIDLTLSLNGIPVATAELKNPMSGQNVGHARHQYEADRDPRERIFEFNRRTLVHFAVDPDQVYMTTRLDGKKTVFLPFNRGDGTGAGNPDNPGGYKTAYLWEEVWQRDSWLDILARFVHLQVEEKTVAGKKFRKETMIFPRYHQLVAVRMLENDARRAGAVAQTVAEPTEQPRNRVGRALAAPRRLCVDREFAAGGGEALLAGDRRAFRARGNAGHDRAGPGAESGAATCRTVSRHAGRGGCGSRESRGFGLYAR